ncbi:hypothetical protein QBC40DRAFT_284370 [Triangularia verruculosa]|uniref:Uncharacterized protein n=1 Tax=Triangularia verruculosa TaxID=2587418 RepID=A0AAN6XDI6_9PEZI|nr:hypothetical protein QBC40DRAFT_284370 [Triangularia verruculosa]
MLQVNLEELDIGIDAYDPNEVPWYPTPSPADLCSAHRLSPKLADWLTKLCQFSEDKNSASGGKRKHEPTKVAILDNGILSISPMPGWWQHWVRPCGCAS